MEKDIVITEEQKLLIPKYEDKWIKQLTTPLDEIETAEAIRKLYAHYSKPMPAIVFGDSPQHCVDLAKAGGKGSKQVQEAIEKGNDTFKNISPKSSSQVSDGMYTSTWWGAWAAWYEFLSEVVGVEFDKQPYEDFMQFVKNIHFSIVFDEVVYISRKPLEVNIENNRLHADLKPAIAYSDGFGIYALNNILIPLEFKELVLTPAKDLSLDLYKKIRSADIRIEFVAKFGVERMKDLGRVIDTYKNYEGHEYWDRFIFGKSQYELIDMSSVYNGDSAAIFLGMVHQGNGSYIMECVGEGITTIKQALESRMSMNLDEYVCESFH